MLATFEPPGGRCATAEVDLEALAAGYRHRPPSAASLEHAACAIVGLPAASGALDVGGGPGHHAAVWAKQGHRAVVVDRADTMVRRAARHRGVIAVRGLAQALPFQDAGLTLAYFHLSLHYGDWRASLRETRRVLAPGGRVVIWTLGPEHHRRSMLAKWFPSIATIDAERFPLPTDVAAELEVMGATVDSGREVEVVRRSVGDWQRAVRAGFVSTLQFIGTAEMAAGLQDFFSAHPDPTEEIAYEMHWDRIVADIPFG